MKSKYIQIIGIMIILVTVAIWALYVLFGSGPLALRLNSIVVAVWPGCFGLFLFIMADNIEKRY